MNARFTRALVLFVVLAGSPLLAAEDLWTENAAEAMATAAKDGKDLLINFTGSDWCGWCIKLDKEVFSQEAFTSTAPKHFVFLKLDFPRKEQSAELKKQNAEWKTRMGIRGFPTIILADATGKAYAKTGYKRGGAEAYVKHLDELRQKRVDREKAFSEAEKLQGIEKAKALDAALDTVDAETRGKDYAHVMEEIIKIDADGKAGLKSKYEALALKGKIDAAMSAGKLDEAIKIADEALVKTGNKGDAAQELLWTKSYACFKKNDKANAQKYLEAALEAAPEGKMAAQIKGVLKRIFKVEK